MAESSISNFLFVTMIRSRIKHRSDSRTPEETTDKISLDVDRMFRKVNLLHASAVAQTSIVLRYTAASSWKKVKYEDKNSSADGCQN